MILQGENYYIVQTQLKKNSYLRCTIVNPFTTLEGPFLGTPLVPGAMQADIWVSQLVSPGRPPIDSVDHRVFTSKCVTTSAEMVDYLLKSITR